ncbi:RED-like, N-terminal [Penicillium expansum]|uniref:RED-like, N-terminal n=1 Tax=Penicillium expansum TaxID=27334 RepID=A0A0A2IL44_PENEN|nr:RED-like, N-terminal [Penicillium expansum]KGO43794.1 RED-like, N-terminal [Penicillium expansum]KGO51960.1 RED-like, N-terminal [Penicillium expansum]KGO65468.1 RED-like, N-terminal [Penicillium expansum]
MNNEQFRRLIADQSSSKPKDQSPAPGRDASRGGATPGGSLGSRMRSSIPMTPRSVTGVDFARQLFEQRREGDRPSKRFKSSAAPKGTSLPTGYQDRAQLRNAEGESENSTGLEARIKALEDMVKLGQIDQATFDKLRRDLGVGGDIASTHMVKGLDMELLKRIRAGEDVSQAAEKPAPPPEKEDVDEEFERLMEEKGLEELAAVPKQQKEKKKGTMAPPPAKPKTRDDILRELRASRAAAAAPAPPPESILSSKFKKLSDGKPEKKRFVERDETGRRREVLLITDAQGNTKRKTRWLDKPIEAPVPPAGDLMMPDKSVKPLGMEIPADIAARAAAQEAPEDDDDIFAGVGDDYNPLAGLEDDTSSDEDGEVADLATRKPEKALVDEEEKKPAASETAPAKHKNYFATGTSTTTEEEPADRSNPLTKDPTILAALKRAAALRQTSPSAEGEAEPSSDTADLRHKRFIEEARRREAMDAADMDMGFGGSRNEDAEEEDDGPLLDFDDDERGGKKRKRGPKKRKGDKDSVTDIMRVVDGRKKETS